MHNRMFLKKVLVTIVMSFTAFTISPEFSRATDSEGWQTDSEYNSYYDYKEADRLKGTILKFKKVTPLPGMSPGTAFILQEGDEQILVHLCPQSFANAKETGIRRGIKTKVKGSWAFIEGEDIFMASKVKQGEHFEFKVRLTKNGKPFWTMEADELAKERASK